MLANLKQIIEVENYIDSIKGTLGTDVSNLQTNYFVSLVCWIVELVLALIAFICSIFGEAVAHKKVNKLIINNTSVIGLLCLTDILMTNNIAIYIIITKNIIVGLVQMDLLH